MARVVAGNVAIDMNDPQIGALAEYDSAQPGPTRILLYTDLYVDDFTGTFTYDLFGNLAGGTLNGWRETYGGQLLFEVTGASVPVSQFLTWVANDDNIGAVSTILAGDDQITGSPFSDLLRGWAGNDVIVAGDGEDDIDGGTGADTVNGGLGNDRIRDAGGTNYLRGDEGNDSIVGGAGFDDINGNAGNDTCISGGGDDWVVGGKDSDSLAGSAGANLVYGNLGSDTCDGGAGNDIVRGGQEADIVLGGAGNDYVSGDKGDDTVTGGTGADIFHTFGDAGIDRVTDFHLSEGDRVQLDPGTQYTVAQVGADTVISMTGGGQMILVGVTMGSLSGSWIFGA
jgi:Ca2+-binding RTX toxin-like protein